MTQRERQGWLIVASLWVTLFIIFGGGFLTAGVFFTPLLKQFGWCRAQLSTLQGSLAISAGISAPLIGWLLDKIEARIVMVVGAVLASAAYLLASQADSFTPMLGAYLLLGVGICAATLLPAALVVSNWFGANRGLALGLTGSGISLGGAGMTLVANAAIARHGWRGGYVALAIPMIVVAIPIMILMVRSRPPQVGARTTMPGAAPALELPGFELALRRRRSVRNQEVGREIQTRCPFPFINSDVISRLGSAVNGAKRSGPAEIGSFRAEPAVPRSADRNRSHRPSAVLPRPRAKPKHRPT